MVFEKTLPYNCRLVREELRAEIWVGMGPVSLLLYIDNVVSFVSANISEGIVLDRMFPYSCKVIREVLRAEIWEGMDPDSLLVYSCNEVSFVSAEISEGIVLEKIFSYKIKLVKPVSTLMDEDIVPFKPLKFRFK